MTTLDYTWALLDDDAEPIDEVPPDEPDDDADFERRREDEAWPR